VLALLLRLKQELGKSVLLITHNLAIGAVADRVVRMRSGEVVEVQENAAPADPEQITW